MYILQTKRGEAGTKHPLPDTLVSDPGKFSGWHYYRDCDVIDYLASGSARFEIGSKDENTTSIFIYFHLPS
jgi:hypothetical protein